MSLVDFLDSVKDSDLRLVLTAVADASVAINGILRNTVQRGANESSTRNQFGDEQLSEDRQAELAVRERLLATRCVSCIASEEEPSEQAGPGHTFAVAYDPLDGSSVLDSNFSVGSIFGVWTAPERLVGCCGRDLTAAVLTLYGPRLLLVVSVDESKLAIRDCGAIAFQYVDASPPQWYQVSRWSRDALRDSKASLFAPGNLRATQEIPAYDQLVRYWIESRYTLRYSGAMAADVYQLLAKRQGIFCNPSQPGKAKLRLVYEALPLAYLVEAVGGRSSDGSRDCASLLQRKITSLTERTSVVLGSPSEVAHYLDIMNI
jgi:sedoheptulose-bisphosphatase